MCVGGGGVGETVVESKRHVHNVYALYLHVLTQTDNDVIEWPPTTCTFIDLL